MQPIASDNKTANGGANTTPSYADVASGGSKAIKRHQEKPTYKPDRHEVPAVNWLTYATHTIKAKCCWFVRAGQNTQERVVPVEDGKPMDWDTTYPILSSTRRAITVEPRVQPAKDLQIPAQFTINNGTKREGMEKKKNGQGLVKIDEEGKKKNEKMYVGRKEEGCALKTMNDEKNTQKEHDMDKETECQMRKEHEDKGYGNEKDVEMKKNGIHKDMENHMKGEVSKETKMVDDGKECTRNMGIGKADESRKIQMDDEYGMDEDLEKRKMDKKEQHGYGQKVQGCDKDMGMETRGAHKELKKNKKRKQWQRMVQGGGEGNGSAENGGEHEKNMNQGRNKKLRFGRTVDVRVLQKEDGNEDTLKTILTDVVDEGVVRLTKPLPASPRRSEMLKDYSLIDPHSPTTTDAEKMVLEANASFEDWPAPEENDTIRSVTIDSNIFPSNNSSFYDDRLDAYSNNELERMIQKERFDPLSYYRITIQFMPEAQQSLMTNTEWIRNNRHQNRSERDFYLDGDAIYAGLLKVLDESTSDKYAVGLPTSLETPYDVDDTRVGVVRRADPEWILQPLYFQEHWILACCNPTTRTVLIYDSLCYKYDANRKAGVKRIVARYFNVMLNTKCTVRWARKDFVMNQEDTINCGVFVVMHARRFAQGRQKLVGRPDDGYDLEEERNDILVLMMCLYQYILLNLDVSAPMQQYIPIDCTFERATRTSPRDLSGSLMRIKQSVAQITPKTRGARNKVIAPIATPQQSPVQSPSPHQSPPSQSSPTLPLNQQSPIVNAHDPVKQRVIQKRKLREDDSSDENVQKRRRISRPGEKIDLTRSIPKKQNSQHTDQEIRRGNKRSSNEDLDVEDDQVKRMRTENVTERRRGRRSEKVARPIDLDKEVDVTSPRRCHKRRRFQVLDDDDDDDPLKKKSAPDGRSGDSESIGSRQ